MPDVPGVTPLVNALPVPASWKPYVVGAVVIAGVLLVIHLIRKHQRANAPTASNVPNATAGTAAGGQPVPGSPAIT